MCDNFTDTGNTTGLLNVAVYVKPESRTRRVMFCNEIAETWLQNTHRIELFATCCRHKGNWLHVQPHSILVTQQF